MSINTHISKPLAVALCFTLVIVLLTNLSCRKNVTVDAISYVTPYSWSDSLRPRNIMVVGDLQPTLWLEQTFLGREQNDSVRAHIVEAALGEKPDLLLLLGDLVADGRGSNDWIAFDSLMAPIVAMGTPVYAVIGNHDYGVFTPKGLPHFRARFPYCTTLPRLVRLADSVVLIVVDSNLELLPKALRQAQRERYQAMLRQCDADPSIRGVIVADHHPPYTNSDLKVDRDIQQDFAIPFLEARKTGLFLSGHVHSYERFLIKGIGEALTEENSTREKTFVISGGGGGPRREVDTSTSRPYKSDQWVHGRLRPHNYLRLQIDSGKIHCKAMMLVDGTFRIGDSWDVEFL